MTFSCTGCGTEHTAPSYVIAQQAQGHEVRFTCPDCGASQIVPRYRKAKR